MSSIGVPVRRRHLGRTSRRDLWWVQLLLTFLGLSLFVVYATWGSLLFFFQAEDGIRDICVTGVQTCALPIWTVQAIGPWRAQPSRRLHRRLLGTSLYVLRGAGRLCVEFDPTPVLGGVGGGGGIRPQCSRHEIGRASCRERVKFTDV